MEGMRWNDERSRDGHSPGKRNKLPDVAIEMVSRESIASPGAYLGLAMVMPFAFGCLAMT
jgi:hypothetical protein